MRVHTWRDLHFGECLQKWAVPHHVVEAARHVVEPAGPFEMESRSLEHLELPAEHETALQGVAWGVIRVSPGEAAA